MLAAHLNQAREIEHRIMSAGRRFTAQCSAAPSAGPDIWTLSKTVREIADHCHLGVATVHAHFQVRKKYEPGTRERHEVALASRDPDRPTVRWRKRLSEA